MSSRHKWILVGAVVLVLGGAALLLLFPGIWPAATAAVVAGLATLLGDGAKTVVGHVASRTMRKAEHEANQSRALFQSSFGRMLLIDDALDVYSLGVGRVVENDPRLPTYIKREKDREFEQRLSDLALTGGFALVIGPPLAGKTRFAAQAMLATVNGWRVLVPASAGNLAKFAESEYPLSEVIIWLDNCHTVLYSLIDEGHVDPAATINLLLNQPRSKPAMVIATMPADRFDDFRRKAAAERPGRYADVWKLLDAARPTYLSDTFNRPELEEADRVAASDELVRRARQHGSRVPASLMNEPALRQAWEAPPHSHDRAVLTAAAHAVRCGHPERISADLLAQLASVYLDPSEPRGDESWFIETVRRLTSTAVVPALRRADGGQPEVYVVSPVIVELTVTDPAARTIPVAAWTVLAEAADPEACHAIMQAARDAGHDDVALVAAMRGAGGGNPDCAFVAGLLLADARREDEAIEYWTIAARAHHPDAAYRLGLLHRGRKDDAAALPWLEQASRNPSPDSKDAAFLAWQILDHVNRPQRAEELLRISADGGRRDAQLELARILRERGDLVNAAHYFRLAADGPEPDAHAARQLAELLGEDDEALRYWQLAAEAGDPEANHRLAYLDPNRRVYWLRRAIDLGHEPALRELGAALLAEGDVDGAIAFLDTHPGLDDNDTAYAIYHAERTSRPMVALHHLTRAADGGHRDAAFTLSQFLPDPARAEHYLRIAADAGHVEAAWDLGNRLGSSDEAMRYLRRAADGGHRAAAVLVGDWLRERDELGLAAHYYELAGADPDALYGLALATRSDVERSARAFRAAADLGHAEAAYEFARRTDEPDLARHYYRLAADRRHPLAAYGLIRFLTDDREIEHYLRIAADGGHPDGAYELIRFLTDDTEINRYLRVAADGDHPQAAYELGMRLESPGEQVFYLRKAADAGIVPAASRVAAILRQQGEIDLALRYYAQAASEDVTAEFELAALLSEHGQRDRALEHFRAAADRGHVQASYEYGVRVRATDPDAACRYLRTIADNGHVEAAFELTSLLADPAEVEHYLRKAADGRHAVAALELAGRLSDPVEVEHYLQIAVDGEQPDAMVALAQIRPEPERSVLLQRAAALDHPVALLQLGQHLVEAGQLVAAEETLTRAVRSGEPAAALLLADILVQQGRQEEAMVLLRRMADENNAEAAYRLGRLVRSPEQAIELFTIAARQGHADAAYRLAYLHPDHDEALAFLRVAAAGHHPQALAELACHLVHEGQFDDAEDAYRQSTDYGNDDARRGYAALLAIQGRPDEALTIVDGHVASDAPTICLLGGLLAANGDTRRARGLLQKAADMGNRPAQANLALLLAEGGQTRAAARVYHRSQRGTLAQSTYLLAVQLAEVGRSERAIRLHKRAADEKYIPALTALASIYWSDGQHARAKILYFRAILAGDLAALRAIGARTTSTTPAPSARAD